MSTIGEHAADLQQQARALGDPTRHSIFRYVAAAGQPVSVGELTEHFGFNHNAIRQHLGKLVVAGLLTEGKAATSGRGRPPVVYVVNPAAEGRWGTTGPYERLSRLLVEIIRTGDTPSEVGRRYGAAMADPLAADALDQLGREMARQGFDPERRDQTAHTEIVLRSCPFETAAAADRDTVCALHLGIAEGLAEGTDVAIDELIANDPHSANCRLRLHRTDDAGAASGSGSLTVRPTRATRPTG